MATLTVIPVKRTGLHYFRHQQIFECSGCLEHIPIARWVELNPEAFVEARERAEDEHRICWTFRNVFEAQRARREKRRGTHAVVVMRSARGRAIAVLGG